MRIIDDASYKHKAWLEQEYSRKGRTLEELGAECGVTRKTIWNWLVKFDIKTLTVQERGQIKNSSRCELCGRILSKTNTIGVCDKRNETNCNQEYNRRFRQEQDSGLRPMSPSRARTDPELYVVHCPNLAVFKIGTNSKANSTYALQTARDRLRRRGLTDQDVAQIWNNPGHLLEETYLQLHLAFIYPPIWGKTRLSEWFQTQDSSFEIIEHVDKIYRRIPPTPAWFQKDQND